MRGITSIAALALAGTTTVAGKATGTLLWKQHEGEYGQ
jgi:hypothetical protein